MGAELADILRLVLGEGLRVVVGAVVVGGVTSTTSTSSIRS
jgi:hypothetical protein